MQHRVNNIPSLPKKRVHTNRNNDEQGNIHLTSDDSMTYDKTPNEEELDTSRLIGTMIPEESSSFYDMSESTLLKSSIE